MRKLPILILLIFLLVSCSSPEEIPNDSQSVTDETTVLDEMVEEDQAQPVQEEVDPLQSRAVEMLEEMTLEEKIGQMFLVACPENDVEEIQKYNFGGIVLFADDFRNSTPDEIIERVTECQTASKIPLFVAVDEEGGTVSRVGRFSQFRATPFLSPRDTFAKYGWQGIEEDAKDKAELLTSLGINLNLAPVCDLSSNQSDFIYKRSFSGKAEEAAQFVSLAVTTMKNGGLMTALKHFPGYSSNADTHTTISYDDRTLSDFINADYQPFIAGIQAGSPFVMVSHNIITFFEDKPASLSGAVHEELGRLGFDGLIMTDDLAMSGITQFTDGESTAVLAVLAGNHVLCTSSYEEEYADVLSAVKSGEISEELIDGAVIKILKTKMEYGLIND
ncbi:MAG: beta-hexosaminidase [Clostridia bacterium]|nr:beta-hexosaminidase [Clostridia bacterium]